MKKTILTAVLVAVATTAQAKFSTRQDLSEGTARDLSSGVIYDVKTDLSLSADPGTSALRVNGKNEVAINIEKGKTLTVTGGSANGTTGAGAAIYVAPGATLYLMGEGTLVATGGAAASGAAGGKGENGWINVKDDVGAGGNGGAGGAGGGGGAAAIGGAGGNGGNGGTGGAGVKKEPTRSKFAGDGGNGTAGEKGASGEAMGKVVILGNLKVQATAGAAAVSDGASGEKGNLGTDAGSGWANDYAAGGGGGGGGGGRGQSAEYGIGGGGAGGSGGGGGGAGGTLCNSVSGHVTGWGAGGKGGASAVGTCGGTGLAGSPQQTSELYYGKSKGGDGGAGGAANTTRGDNGTLMVGASVQFAASPRRASNTPLATVTTVLYESTITFYSEGKKTGESRKASLMHEMPGMPEITRNGYRFLGYFTAETGGTCVYGPDGTPCAPVWESVAETVDLYAQWEVAPTMLLVNTNEDGENLGDGKVTLRDAVRALSADAMLCGTSGLRRIEFDLKAENGKNVITLTSALKVAGGTAPFQISGYNGGNGVTITTSGKDFSPLELTGSDVRLDSINFKSNACPAVVYSGAGYLTISDCSFIENSGGAVKCGDKSTLVAMNCTFSENKMSGGGVVQLTEGAAYGAFVNCTFHQGSQGYDGRMVSSASASLVFVHCTMVSLTVNDDYIVSAPNSEVFRINTLMGTNSGKYINAKKMTSICSADVPNWGKLNELFSGGAKSETILGIDQVWFVPLQETKWKNRDAAQIYYDYRLENLAIVTNGVTDAIIGDAALATMPLVIDQLHTVRLAPVRGSIRIASGDQPPTVNVEGIVWGPAALLANTSIEATANIYYDGETSASGSVPVTVKTNDDAAFGVSVEVEGSDLSSRNVTSIEIKGLPNDPTMTVASSPYALVAASASALVTDASEVELPGDEIRIGTALADSLVVSKLSVGGELFSAGALAGFKTITLDDVNVRGGSLRILGAKTKDGGAQMANLANKTIGGGDDEESGSLSNGSMTWTAQYDGFVQVRVEASATASGKNVGLTVGGLTVTPLGALGASGARTPIWTVPVKKGETVTLSSNFTIGYKVQFIYFGVKD